MKHGSELYGWRLRHFCQLRLFLKYNRCQPNIIDISCVLFELRIQYEIGQSQVMRALEMSFLFGLQWLCAGKVKTLKFKVKLHFYFFLIRKRKVLKLSMIQKSR